MVRVEHPASELVVPLTADDEILATCRITGQAGREFSDHEVETARRICAMAALAIRSEDLHVTRRRPRGELEAVLRVSESATRSLEVNRALGDALQECLAVTGLDAGAVFLFDEESDDLVLAARRGEPAGLLVDRLPAPGSVLGDVAVTAEPRLIRDVTKHPSFRFQRELEEAGVSALSAVAAPLIWEDEVIGVVALGSLGTRELDRHDLSFLVAVSRPIAVAVGNARLFAGLQRSNAERRELVAALVNAQEAERQRVAEDIHDDTIQVMASVSMRLSTMRYLNRADPDSLAGIEEAARATQNAMERLRNLMFELHPPALDLDGVGAAVREYVKKIFGRDDPVVRVEDRLWTPLPPAIRITMYRIAIEALANVRKHARASRVDVTLGERGGRAFVRIEDDGVGLPSGSVGESPPGHLGVTTMRERARLAGGSCSIESGPNGGTTVQCWLPIDLDEGGAA